ncbi:squalene synthase HpnC [Curvibacter sp. APW13]|uniref:squalene synthase HpnC n=1 Tax=Curvibacter sp. APW13 TaxID=3077236 RepID=UPI0028DDDCAD|nr:squalene synthase HpnC [Curvibacter sp. APW13]MDT8991220.1 squalene synthase HpnC [Curvibacter sp. APW13]
MPPDNLSASAPPPVVHYENFPVASVLCPPALRSPIAAIYHFARTADDLADEGAASAHERLAQLHAFRAALQQATATTPYPTEAPWFAVMRPLQAAIQRYQLPVNLLEDLLDAFSQDVRYTADGHRYADEAELLDYCRRSANPVGRLLLHLYGIDAPQALAWSDDICTALQLINFWQDLGRDIAQRRYYLPLDGCAQFGYSEADMQAARPTPSATNLVASLAHSARARMLNGTPLVHHIPGRAGWELRLVVQGGLRILDKIEAVDHATVRQRPVLRWWDYAVMLWRAAWM